MCVTADPQPKPSLLQGGRKEATVSAPALAPFTLALCSVSQATLDPYLHPCLPAQPGSRRFAHARPWTAREPPSAIHRLRVVSATHSHSHSRYRCRARPLPPGPTSGTSCWSCRRYCCGGAGPRRPRRPRRRRGPWSCCRRGDDPDPGPVSMICRPPPFAAWLTSRCCCRCCCGLGCGGSPRCSTPPSAGCRSARRTAPPPTCSRLCCGWRRTLRSQSRTPLLQQRLETMVTSSLARRKKGWS